MYSCLESVWAGEVRILYVHCVPTACVQAMRPGTCPLHRNSGDCKPRGGRKELRHTPAVGFVQWAGIKCFIRYDAEARCAWPCVARPPGFAARGSATRGSASFRAGPAPARCSAGLLCLELASCAPTLLPACLLAAGPCSQGSCFRCLASIRGSVRRGRAGRDPAPHPYLGSDPLFPALLA